MNDNNSMRAIQLLILILAGCLLTFSRGILAADASLILWNRNFDTAPVDRVLELALEKTRDLYPPAEVKRSSPMEYAQAIASLRKADGRVTVLNAASSIENDSHLLAVHFPVLKGLLGYRMCLIRKGDQARFDDVVTAHDFQTRGLRVCQGGSWPDTAILKRNGLPLLTSDTYTEMFGELSRGHCDCFLRGAQEIIPEYQARHNAFDIESSFAIYYAEPGFFYVNKNHPELATRIELGLLRALDDGSYAKLFQELMGTSLKQLDISHRKIIRLANPNASPINRSTQSVGSLWYKP